MYLSTVSLMSVPRRESAQPIPAVHVIVSSRRSHAAEHRVPVR
jgi:hypothetical protein